MTSTDIPLAVTTIGGYLGSGKTTLVNHLLRHANGRRLAVLVNEFGELAIDEDLIEAQDDDLISIAGGCICCSFGNDLTAALIDLSKMTPKPDHILIESSGVAIPGAIVATLSLLDAFQSDGIVVVVDAETIQHNATNEYIGDTITRQLNDAEIILLNKLDLITAPARLDLEAWLKVHAHNAPIITATQGKVLPEAIIGVISEPGKGAPGTHADDLFDSIVLTPRSDINVQALAQSLATGPFGIVRAKGFATDQTGRQFLIHVVGARHSVTGVTQRFEDGIVCLGVKGQLNKDALLDNIEQS